MLKKEIESPYHNRLNATKVVVFMEIQPQSDKFAQIMLNEQAYKNVLRAIEDELQHNESEEFVVVCSNKHWYSFPEIHDTYTEEEIQRNDK